MTGREYLTQDIFWVPQLPSHVMLDPLCLVPDQEFVLVIISGIH